jgi:pyruvate,water dikinase
MNLGRLFRIPGVHVPEGFCVTTEAYQQAVAQNETVLRLIDQLAELHAADQERIRDISGKIRQAIIQLELPAEVTNAMASHLSKLDEEHAYAVRSSATAEDSLRASYAGQHDSYLNITGMDAVVDHVRRCWASLYTDRAVIYRMQNGVDHRHLAIAVVVQRMIASEASGIMFTADPITANRKVLSIEAGFGLGEGLVSGLVSADHYRVREGEIIERRIAAQTSAVYGSEHGGTELKPVDPGSQLAQVLTDQQIMELSRIGKQIEAACGQPQDIEWCLVQDTFYIVQSRPITTLFPIPAADDDSNRVYISVGHQQMMTDAMRPLGLSFYLMTTPAPMRTAGGRLFVDVTAMLASPESRFRLLSSMAQHDPLMKDALLTVIEQDYIQVDKSTEPSRSSPPPASSPLPDELDPNLVSDLIQRSEASIEACKQEIQTKSGIELMDYIQEDILELRKFLFDPQSMLVINSAIQASAWINEHMKEWLGEQQAADALAKSVPGNITSEMGLALLDVADVLRPYPEIIEYLQQTKDDDYLDELVKFDGGRVVREAIGAFLDKYGMRCAGEIDITKPRWREKPATLIPLILSNIKNHEPNASRRKFEQGQQEALATAEELLRRLSMLPDGDQKAQDAKRMIDLIRNFSGYREYPKYAMVNRYFIYKQALLREAQRLFQSGVIEDAEDIWYLSFEELREVVRTKQLDQQIISKRKDEYQFYAKLTPPRVITSDGEIFMGEYRRGDLPDGAIAGIAVSSGIVEGRARVITNMEDADLEEGDILVTAFTDPSWTPLFVSIRGLVTEVGGLMTHGAVIAREYGLPAVVGVDHATKRIQDGQRIRVNGTEGYIEIL